MANTKALIEIGRLAVLEQAARTARNRAQAETRKWRKAFGLESGEPFVADDAEPEEVAEYDALVRVSEQVRATYYRARAATRWAIARASAAEGV